MHRQAVGRAEHVGVDVERKVDKTIWELCDVSCLVFCQVVRQFELSWCGATEHLDIVTHLINKPNQPVRIGFKRRG